MRENSLQHKGLADTIQATFEVKPLPGSSSTGDRFERFGVVIQSWPARIARIGHIVVQRQAG